MAIIDPTHDFLAFLQGVALTLFYLAATSCVAVQSALLTNMVLSGEYTCCLVLFAS